MVYTNSIETPDERATCRNNDLKQYRDQGPRQGHDQIVYEWSYPQDDQNIVPAQTPLVVSAP